MFYLFSDDRGKATCYYHHKIDQPVNVKVFLLIYPSNVSNVLLQIFKLRYGTRNFPFLVSIHLPYATQSLLAQTTQQVIGSTIQCLKENH